MRGHGPTENDIRNGPVVRCTANLPVRFYIGKRYIIRNVKCRTSSVMDYTQCLAVSSGNYVGTVGSAGYDFASEPGRNLGKTVIIPRFVLVE